MASQSPTIERHSLVLRGIKNFELACRASGFRNLFATRIETDREVGRTRKLRVAKARGAAGHREDRNCGVPRCQLWLAITAIIVAATLWPASLRESSAQSIITASPKTAPTPLPPTELSRSTTPVAPAFQGPISMVPAGLDASGNMLWTLVPAPPNNPSNTLTDAAAADAYGEPNSATSLTAALAPDAAASTAAPAVPAIKYPTVQINGVLQADAGFFNQSEANKAQFGPIQDGADFRRVRLSAKGAVSEVTNYFVQMDFGFFGRPTFTDVWMETTDLPILGNVRIGQWKQPFSLEVVSSFRYTTFMERSSLFQPFTPFRHLGIGFYDHSEDLRNTWAASFFRTGQDQFGGSISTDGGWGAAERATWLPYWDEASNGASYLHLGAGHFYNNPPRDTVNFRSIPEIYIGENGPGVIGTSGQAAPGAFNGTPFFAQTGPLAVSQYNVFGGELLWVRGPLSLQSEAMVTFVQKSNGSEATLPGAYAQVGYFLTGEHRPYDRKAGAIDRVIPHENFFRVRTDHGTTMGTGAWEVAARVSWLDLEDQAVRGGTLLDGTLGVNWYLNPYSKLVFNYVHSVPDPSNAGASSMNAFAVRAQLDF